MMKFFATLMMLTVFAAWLAAAHGTPPPRPEHRRPPRPPMMQNGPRSQRNPGMWRAFSQLSQKEQQELMKLQRTDPEKFRAVMQEKVAEFHAELQARQQKISDLVAKINASKDEKEKSALRAELRSIFKTSFESRISHLRRNIESNKKRIEMMEKELKKREANADAIIDTLTDAAISGKMPVPGKKR